MQTTLENVQHEKYEIVVNPKIDPSYFAKKTPVSAKPERVWSDAKAWDDMARKHLKRYTLPAWSAPCHVEAMELWLDRLDMTPRNYDDATGFSLQEFIDLNPTWPLRAWIGTALELLPP